MSTKSTTTTTDVLVIGAGATGIPAAVAAARMGAHVVLVEEDALVGGAMVDQYVTKPGGGPRTGITGEYIEALENRFKPAANTPKHHWSHWFLPSDYTRVFHALLSAEKNLDLRCGLTVSELLAETDGSDMRITGACLVRNGADEVIKAKVTIDATGSGALAEKIGCRVLYGEDARDEFGEAIAPETGSDKVQQCCWMFISQKRRFDAPPLNAAQFNLGILEPGYTFSDLDPKGFAERNTGMYLHWGTAVHCADTRDPEALAAAQTESLEIMADDLAYLDEHGYAVYMAPKIGVREERRVVGEHVLNFNDMAAGRIPDDSVTVTGRAVDLWTQGKDCFDYPKVSPYGIPFRSLLPKGTTGLLVAGKHLSATHLAMASFRVQIILGNVGQVAGAAAARAAENGRGLRDINISKLREALRESPHNLNLSPTTK